MPMLDVNGLRMHAHVQGEGPPLVLIMGLSGDLTWWNALVGRLQGAFRVIAFDNRGAGLTDKPDDRYSISLFAEDTLGLLDALGVGSAHVFGVSMGGMIAQELALAAPERVDRLVLGCTHPGGKGLVLPSAEALENISLTRGKSREEVARRTVEVLFSPAFRQREREVVQAVVDRYVSNPPPRKAFTNQFWAVAAHNCWDRLPQIRHPTLVLTGDADRLIPPVNSERIQARVAGARLVFLRGAGHAFFIERPDETATLLREHLLEDTEPGLAGRGAPEGDGHGSGSSFPGDVPI